MSELYDDIARGCLENGEPIEARWGSGEWTPQPEQEQPPTDMDIWNDLQRQLDQLKTENERLQARVQELEQEREVDGLHDLIDEQDKQIKEMQKLINEQDKQIQKLFEAEQKWIPVSERVSDDNVQVLTINMEHGEYDVCEYIKNYKGYYDKETMNVDVTHWQPLPQPPKERE